MSARANDSWIELTASVGHGADASGYEVKSNRNLAARTGTITVGGQQFSVAQGGATSISGRVRSVDGSCPNKRFTINGQRIRTTSGTEYEGGSCGDLRDGVAVRIKGVVERRRPPRDRSRFLTMLLRRGVATQLRAARPIVMTAPIRTVGGSVVYKANFAAANSPRCEVSLLFFSARFGRQRTRVTSCAPRVAGQ